MRIEEHETYKKVYKDRRKKVGKAKARYSARATVIAEELQIWLKENVKKSKKKDKKHSIENKKEYPEYQVGKYKVVLTTNRKDLDDFPISKNKGLIGSIEKEFDKEVLYKLSKNKDVKLAPNLFYVIYGD